jgi:hypothetical protein
MKIDYDLKEYEKATCGTGIYEKEWKTHPDCLVRELVKKIQDIRNEIVDAKLYMVENGDENRVWSEEDTLTQWVHKFGLDVYMEKYN